MIAALRSEWLLLNRARLWVALGVTTIAFSVVATALSVAAAEPGPARGRGISSDVLTGAGGATAAVIYAVGFGSILMLAAFTSTAANEFTRGTFRAAVVKHPDRGTLVGGKVLARTGVAALMMAAAVVAGSVTAALVAPSQDISTAGWFGLDGLGQAAGDYVRLVVWVLGWAVIGTTIAVLVRSTPIALGIAVLWFGPIENVIGDGHAWAYRWFPGQLLRAIVAPDAPDMVSTGTAAATLAVYGAICVAVMATVLRRRDVTS